MNRPSTYATVNFRFIFIAAILILLSCTNNSSSDKSLRIGNGAEPESLDPHLCSSVPCLRILSTLLEGLTLRGIETTEVRPGIAKSWAVSEDGKTIRFFLRKALWSDSVPVSAHDFEYAWKRLADPKTGSRYSFLLSGLRNASDILKGIAHPDSLGVFSEDSMTLRVQLEAPTPYFLDLCSFESMSPLRKDIIEKFASQWTDVPNFIENGAYTLHERRDNQFIIVRKNNVYDQSNSLAPLEIFFYPVDNNNTELSMFETGELDWIHQIPPSKIQFWLDRPEFVSQPRFGLYLYRINVTRAPFTDVRVRKALNLAIDRDRITKYVTKGGEISAQGFVPPGISWYPKSDFLTFNPAYAVQLLGEAGFPSGENFPEVELLYNTGETNKQIAEVVANMWRTHLKIPVKLLNFEWKVLLQSMSRLEYDVARGSWIGDYNDPSTFTDLFISGNGNNRTGYSNLEYDSLAQIGATEMDFTRRLMILKEQESILMEDLPVIPLYFMRAIELRNPRITNVGTSPLGLYSYKDIQYQ
jgi:oligopeptide transport system substrate-binding protein